MMLKPLLIAALSLSWSKRPSLSRGMGMNLATEGLAAVMTVVTLGGWGLGTVIRSLVPWTGLTGFAVECMLWLAIVALMASPLLSRDLRDRLITAIPR